MKRKAIIIAEAGVNHNGSLELAKQLIDSAKGAGADFVKFQSFKADELVSKVAPKAVYQNMTTNDEETQYEMIKRLELNIESHKILIDYCKLKKIGFLSSAFDLASIDLLNELGLKTFKIPSGEINNLPYLRKLGKLDKNIILSTGMANLGEIESAIKILVNNGTSKEKITVLHCNTEYPTPYEDVNLLAMLTIKNSFGVKVGYSDHTEGIEIPIASVALGAEVIEKHFTLDCNMEGPDHKASLEPGELKEMVRSIRNIEKALGDGIKTPTSSESKNKEIVRKSIVAAIHITKGQVFTEKNLGLKRPGNGISPMLWDNLIGKKASRDFQKDELIEL